MKSKEEKVVWEGKEWIQYGYIETEVIPGGAQGGKIKLKIQFLGSSVMDEIAHREH